MFFKLNLFPIYSAFVSVILISNSFTFGQNPDSNSSSLNANEDKTISVTAPKLLGIFADNLNDSTNIVNENVSNSSFHQMHQAKIERLIANGKRIPVQKSYEKAFPVQLNSSQKSLHYSIERRIDSNEDLADKKSKRISCKRLDFVNRRIDENSESFDCILGSESDPFLQTNDIQTYDLGVYLYQFYIPDEEMESINKTSYIAMMVDICSEPGGKVLIVDEGSDEQLLSFNNMNSAYMCNHFGDNDFESFASDSSRVRVEIWFPSVDDLKILPQFMAPGEEATVGERLVTTSSFKLTIKYFEIKFTQNDRIPLYPDNSTYMDGIEAIYVPNSVLTYILNEPNIDEDQNQNPKMVVVGVNITLDYLNIDIDKGDFVLIGPGAEPTHRELSKAQIISENILTEDDQKKIWINADSAYIRLVTHNSLKHQGKQSTAIKFSWFPAHVEVEDLPQQEVSDQIKGSAIQVCVMGYQCYSFHNALEDKFKDEIVHMANNYLFNNDPKAANQLISSKSVLIFDEENGVYGQKKDKNEIYCQMSVAITSPYTDQWPLINHRTLHYLFFGNNETITMHSFGSIKVTDCSHESISLLKMILPIIVILVVSCALLLAAWRYQYKNWTQLQRVENAKYKNTSVTDQNEDVLYVGKDNPIFIDDEGNQNRGKASNALHKSNDEVDGRPPLEHRKLRKELSHGSSVSSKRLSSVKESPEFVKNLWMTSIPSTSRQQNEYVFDNDFGDDKISDDFSATPIPKAESLSKSSAERLSPQTAITGLNGTQHESLRNLPKAFPQKSALRPTLSNRTAASDIDLSSPETNPFRRSSKVQFELPKPSIQVHYSSSEDLSD